MSIGSINFGRVTQNLQAFNLLAALRSNNFGLFRVQNQLATGLKFTAPSDDPTSAATVGRVNLKLDRLSQINANLRTANGSLTAADSAMSEAIDLLRSARSNASQAVGDTITSDERAALATVIDSIVQQAVTIGNRKFLDSALFSGHLGNAPAFEITNEGIVFRGDSGRMQTIVDTDLSQDSFTISGNDFFGGFSPAVRGSDLNPAISADTRLSDLSGANGKGVRLGRIRIADAVMDTEIDLSGADTVGDVIDALNAGLPGGWDASVTTNGIRVTNSGIAGNEITIADVGGGRAAADLGLMVDEGIAAGGVDLNPRVTLRTPLSDLRGVHGGYAHQRDQNSQRHKRGHRQL
jgi:flagellar hook-associated protein 3 FlgL